MSIVTVQIVAGFIREEDKHASGCVRDPSAIEDVDGSMSGKSCAKESLHVFHVVGDVDVVADNNTPVIVLQNCVTAWDHAVCSVSAIGIMSLSSCGDVIFACSIVGVSGFFFFISFTYESLLCHYGGYRLRF